MGRVDSQAFAEKELARIFIAASLREAKRVEEILTAEGVDYAVKIESFIGGFHWRAHRGAAFYVISGQAGFCRKRLVEAGLERGVLGDD